MLSTMLYSACTSMEMASGSAMVINRRLTGITPILFSGTGLSCIVFSFFCEKCFHYNRCT